MKAVLVFCEGHTDVVFVQRSLGAISPECRWYDGAVKDLPTPFGGSANGTTRNGFIATQFNRNIHVLELRSAVNPPTPHFCSVVRDDSRGVLYFQIVMGGINNPGGVIQMIDLVNEAVNVSGVEVSKFASAIICDANDIGLQKRLKRLRSDYCTLSDSIAELAHAKWVDAKMCKFGVFVFHHADHEFGTLENHVEDMVKLVWPERYECASKFIDCARKKCDFVLQRDADRLKAIITAAGQLEFPGRPLSRVIDRRGIPPDRFRQLPECTKLVEFLQNPWKQDLMP